jgi:hypothetical protein
LFDERWPAEAEEFAAGLDAVLTKYCPPEMLRAADDTGAPDGLAQLSRALDDFGLWELPAEPYLLTRAAVSLGAKLAPVPFASAVPAQVVLGEQRVANGVDRAVVPAGLPRILTDTGGGLGIVATPTEHRRSAAGEDVVLVDTVDEQPTSVSGDIDAIRAWGFLLEAARLVGAAQALIGYGVAYVSDRRQFGVPVGSFQGVSHPLAEAATSVQAADLLTRHAAYLAETDSAVPFFASVMAAAKARTASRQAAATVHQALGGYGFTLEADCQLYTRRIRAWTAAMPDPVPWLGRLARTLTDPAARDQVSDLWQFDRGFTLPRWARESR